MFLDRVLAFGCHPDDVEFECAGTLIMLAKKGYEIHIATMAGGELGSPDLSTQATRIKRLKECEDSAAIIGAKFHYAGGYDVDIEYSGDLRRKATAIVRDVDPLIVFTHPPMDYMVDHEETSRLVRNAAYIASAPNYDCGRPTTPTDQIPYLYYWNAFGHRDIFGRPLPISNIIDISSAIETKKQMLSAHASQREWLEYHNNVEYVGIMTKSSAEQGKVIGADYAEGFIQHLGNNHPQDNILKAIFEDLCVEI